MLIRDHRHCSGTHPSGLRSPEPVAVPPPAQDDQPSLYPLRPGQVAREPRSQTPAGRATWCGCGKRGSSRPLTRVLALRHPSRRTIQMRWCGPGQPDSPHRTSRHRPARADSSTTAQPVQALVPPHGPRRSAAPAAKGGHVRSSAPTSLSRGSRRLHRAPARGSLSASPQRRGRALANQRLPSAPRAPRHTLGPAHRAAVAVATAWREGWRLTSTEPTRGALRQGLEGGGGLCSTPKQRSGGSHGESLTNDSQMQIL